MKFLAAYLLSSLNGQPTLESINAILSSVGIEQDDDQVQKLLTQLEGKSLDEVIAEGNLKLASVPSGGAAVASSAPAAGASSGGAAPAKAQEKEEEKEESDEDMGFGLFD